MNHHIKCDCLWCMSTSVLLRTAVHTKYTHAGGARLELSSSDDNNNNNEPYGEQHSSKCVAVGKRQTDRYRIAAREERRERERGASEVNTQTHEKRNIIKIKKKNETK